MKGSKGTPRNLWAVAPVKFAVKNRNRLLQLMCELEMMDRDILVRKFFQDMKNEEIAEHMGLNESMVESRITFTMGLRNDWRE